METAIVLVVFVVAASVQGAAGFGFGLVAISLLSCFIDIKDASVVLSLASLCMNAFIFWRLREHFRFDRIAPLMFAAVVGAPLGVLLLVHADAHLLKRLLGIILLLTVANGCVPRLADRPWHPIVLGVPCGLLSGALSGAYATGGPPLVAYVRSQGFDKFRYSATLQIVFALNTTIRLIALGATGVFTKRLLALSVWGIGCAVIGAWLGLHVLKRMPERILRRVVAGLLLVMGTKYLLF